MPIIISPGAGPVDGPTTEAQARANMGALIADVNQAAITPDTPATFDPACLGTDGDGRFTFVLIRADGTTVAVDMPGLPLDRVRYMGAGVQNIWDFPRLYIDGSSWIWAYAINIILDNEA